MNNIIKILLVVFLLFFSFTEKNMKNKIIMLFITGLLIICLFTKDIEGLTCADGGPNGVAISCPSPGPTLDSNGGTDTQCGGGGTSPACNVETCCINSQFTNGAACPTGSDTECNNYNYKAKEPSADGTSSNYCVGANCNITMETTSEAECINRKQDSSVQCNFVTVETTDASEKKSVNCPNQDDDDGCFYLPMGTKKPSTDLLSCCEAKAHCKCGTDGTHPYIGDIFNHSDINECVIPELHTLINFFSDYNTFYRKYGEESADGMTFTQDYDNQPLEYSDLNIIDNSKKGVPCDKSYLVEKFCTINNDKKDDPCHEIIHPITETNLDFRALFDENIRYLISDFLDVIGNAVTGGSPPPPPPPTHQ